MCDCGIAERNSVISDGDGATKGEGSSALCNAGLTVAAGAVTLGTFLVVERAIVLVVKETCKRLHQAIKLD